MSNISVNLDGKEIICNIHIKKVKNINMHIKKDCTLYISTPKGVDNKRIIDIILDNKGKILASIDRIKNNKLLKEFTYNNNDIVCLLNDRYTVNFVKGKSLYYIDNNHIDIHLYNTDNYESRKKAYDKFMTDFSIRVFTKILDDIYDKHKQLPIKYPIIKVRNMTSCWGNCRPNKGIITLNKKLIEYDKYLIEYVICHELAHFLEANHSSKFYEQLQKLVPDYKHKRKRLKEEMYI